MLKLARNALAEYKVFNTVDGIIEWKLIAIIALHNIQQLLTMKFKNKLNAQCVKWQQNKMKVKYAANTLSAYVANSMKYLKNKGVKEFQDCEATVKLIETIDWLFDILNSRSPYGKGFKKPLTRDRLAIEERWRRLR